GWNFGPADEDARPVGWIVERVVELWAVDVAWALDERQPPHDARYLKLVSPRAKGRLGWRPPVGLEQALQSIVDWYQALSSGADMRAGTLRQIEGFSHG